MPCTSSWSPLDEEEEADSRDEELPVRFQVPTRGSDEPCRPPSPLLPPPSLFQVPVRLRRGEGEGLSEWERLGFWLLFRDEEEEEAVEQLDGAGRVEEQEVLWLSVAGANGSSDFLLPEAEQGASLMKVDWRTRAGRSAPSPLGPAPTPLEA